MNSSSTRTAAGRCVITVSRTWFADRPVFSSSTLAPSLPHATIDSTMPAWLRHITATRLPCRTPCSASPFASRVVRWSTSRNVSVPSSSAIACSFGNRTVDRAVAAGDRRTPLRQHVQLPDQPVRPAGGEHAGLREDPRDRSCDWLFADWSIRLARRGDRDAGEVVVDERERLADPFAQPGRGDRGCRRSAATPSAAPRCDRGTSAANRSDTCPPGQRSLTITRCSCGRLTRTSTSCRTTGRSGRR